MNPRRGPASIAPSMCSVASAPTRLRPPGNARAVLFQLSRFVTPCYERIPLLSSPQSLAIWNEVNLQSDAVPFSGPWEWLAVGSNEPNFSLHMYGVSARLYSCVILGTVSSSLGNSSCPKIKRERHVPTRTVLPTRLSISSFIGVRHLTAVFQAYCPRRATIHTPSGISAGPFSS